MRDEVLDTLDHKGRAPVQPGGIHVQASLYPLCPGGVTQNPLFPQQQKHSNMGDVSTQGSPLELSAQLRAGHVRHALPKFSQGKQANSPGTVLSGIQSLISVSESNAPLFSYVLWQTLLVVPQYQLVVDSGHCKSQVCRCQHRADWPAGLVLAPLCMNGLHLPEREISFQVVSTNVSLSLLVKSNSNAYCSFFMYLTPR